VQSIVYRRIDGQLSAARLLLPDQFSIENKGFLGSSFLAGFLAAGFDAAGFFAAGFLAAAFFTAGFLAAGFDAAGFFTAAFLTSGSRSSILAAAALFWIDLIPLSAAALVLYASLEAIISPLEALRLNRYFFALSTNKVNLAMSTPLMELLDLFDNPVGYLPSKTWLASLAVFQAKALRNRIF
jgi:hypothetical protein